MTPRPDLNDGCRARVCATCEAYPVSDRGNNAGQASRALQPTGNMTFLS